MNIRRLQVFLEILEAGSLSAAARRLRVSQPTVSQHLRQLEEDLDTELLHRGPGGLRPTDAGTVLAGYARDLVRLTAEAREATRAAGRADALVLAIGATTTVGSYLVPPLLQAFRRRFPQVAVDLHIGNQEDIARRLLSGACSIALVAGRLREERLVQLPLSQEELVLAAGRGHRLRGHRITPAQLAGEVFLLREAGSSDRRAQEETLALWGLQQARTAQVGSAEAIKRLLETGHGVALLSRPAVHRELVGAELTRLDVHPAPPRRLISAAYRADHALTVAERALLALAREPAPASPASPTTPASPTADRSDRSDR
ncbi:LysR family transcriptional regulator [Kitasatospora sp. NPDC048239]|uniref:LysR family transcriptional regulator n=1 Tax=Kitasatospora sp. NPDC048239 TaxID=3364046 RepID=UPI003713253D